MEAKKVEVPLSVVAVVATNGREALVLNRPLSFVYERYGMDYIGTDGPFRDVLKYERGSGRFVAFAGREIELPMADGSIARLKDHWWQSGLQGYVGVIHGDIESLKKCYVFSGGAQMLPADFDVLRSTYAGCVYPYWDYEKVITFTDMRSDLYRRLFHEERRRKALIASIKEMHAELLAARAGIAKVRGDAQ